MTTKTSRSEPPRRAAHHPRHRDGRSVTFTPNNVPTSALIAMGFAEEAAQLMLAARRVLPIVEDPTIPQIDARKLWERIGKPHKQFNKWADHYIKPRKSSDEVLEKKVQKLPEGSRGGRPRKDYTLSRSFAADLAMQANTEEGAQIRRYFRLMEYVVVRLTDRNALRGQRLVELDNAIYHQAVKINAEKGLRGSTLKAIAKEEEVRLKSRITLILTGFKPRYWTKIFGRGLRDILSGKDMATYEAAYSMAHALLTAGKAEDEDLAALIGPAFKGKIDMRPYLEERGLDPELADVQTHIAKQRVSPVSVAMRDSAAQQIH